MGRDRSSHASPRQHYRPGTARHRGVSKVRKVKEHSSGRTKLLQKRLHELSRFEHDRTPCMRGLSTHPRKRFFLAFCPQSERNLLTTISGWGRDVLLPGGALTRF